MDTARTGRLLAACAVVVTSCLVTACDLEIGPPAQDVGYEHNVGPATGPPTGGHKTPPDSGP